MNIEISKFLEKIEDYTGPKYPDVMDKEPVIHVIVKNKHQLATILGYLLAKGYYRPSGTDLLEWLSVYGDGAYVNGLSIHPTVGQAFINLIKVDADYVIL